MRILERRDDRDLGAIRFRQRQQREHLRVQKANLAAGAQLHVLPKTRIAIANAWDPVPAFRRRERGSVDGYPAAIFTGARRYRLFMRNSWMRRRRHAHSNDVDLTRVYDLGDIEHAADEGAANVPHPRAIDPGLRGVIDSLKRERQALAGKGRRRLEARAIPVVLAR